VKKCTSCSKDLPDAALHCVFCGAKQPSAPAQPAGMAKTVMGYSAQEMIAQMRQQGVPGATPAQAPAQAPAPAPAPMAAPVPMMQPAVQQSAGTSSPITRPAPAPPAQNPQLAATIAPGQMNVPIGAPPAMNPQLAATIAPSQMNPQLAATIAPQQMNPQLAATIAPSQMSPFAPPPGNQGAVLGVASPPSAQGTGPGHGPGPSIGSPVIGGGGVLTGAQPVVSITDDKPKPAPVAPRPVVSGTAQQSDELHGPVKMMMLVSSVLLLLTLVVPVSLDPLAFPFEAFKNLGDMETSGMISALLWPIIAVVGLLVALLSMPTTVKGVVALLLGVAGIATMLNTFGFAKLEWQDFVLVASQVLLLGGLVIRSKYHASMPARILATLGALMCVAVWLVPGKGEGIPLLGLFDLFGAGTKPMLFAVVTLLGLAFSTLGLLAWLPGTSSAGTGAIALLALLFTLGGFGMVAFGFAPTVVGLAVGDGDFQHPITLLAWVPITSLLGLAGWGLAGVLGKPAT
jgi:hypothetical protein